MYMYMASLIDCTCIFVVHMIQERINKIALLYDSVELQFSFWLFDCRLLIDTLCITMFLEHPIFMGFG